MKNTKWDVSLYNEKHRFVHEYGSDLVSLLDPQPNELVLDLGCGSGQLTQKIAKLSAKVIGIDSSKEMIETSKQLFPTLDFHQMDAQSFEFNHDFDAIFSNAVLHWVTDQKAAAKNMFRHLKEGGRLVVEFGAYNNVASIVNALRSSLKDQGYYKNANLQRWYFPTISEYTFLLEDIGFEVVFAQIYDRPTPLESKSNGIKDWIEMFGSHFFEGVDQEHKLAILEQVQNAVKNACLKDQKWYADYRRIRVVAFKNVIKT